MKIEHERHKKFAFSLKNAALLVIDVQNYFTNDESHAFIPSSPPIIPRINELARTFHKAGRPVVYTRHIDVDPENMMSRWWGERIEETNPLSELDEDLETSLGMTMIKHQYDAFLNTSLEEVLQMHGTKQVVITGVVTHLCCETTARSAFMRNFEVFFVTDCTAAKDPKHHKATIFNLAYGFAIPVEYQKLIKACHCEL